MSSPYPPSHSCGALRPCQQGETVSLAGWVHRRRDHGGLIFVDLRDRAGLTQLVFDPEKNPEAHLLGEQLRTEWVIAVRGLVAPRAEGMANPQLATGQIELLVDQVTVLSAARTPPFSICDEKVEVNEELRLRYRYLDMRRGTIAQNLRLRHRAMMATRQFLDSQLFTEVSTPILGKSTPEGARDYLVPSRVHPGFFYALPQSPQLYKQLLMVGGLERYFQIAPCFRDEDLRADRQPEFTQIDIEMSFVTQETLLSMTEQLIAHIFREAIGVELHPPFQRMTFAESMAHYGTDRPDLRYGMRMYAIEELAAASSFSVFQQALEKGGTVKGFCVKGGADVSRKAIQGYTEFVAQFGLQGLAWMKLQEGRLTSSIVKFFDDALQQQLISVFSLEEGDLLLLLADESSKVNQALDHLRRHIAKERELIREGDYQFVWIIDFPLFRWDEEEQRLSSEHHPFTRPHPDELGLLDSDPLKMRACAYDIVVNGYELGGGSERIYDPQLQQRLFERLGLTPQQVDEQFGFFVKALQYGTPPHLGIALGFDRLIMLLCQSDNIRDVIAFPKTQNASDLMNGAPSSVSERQLQELSLKLSSSIKRSARVS